MRKRVRLAKMPIRTCIGCRTKVDPQQMLRIGQDHLGQVGPWKGFGRSCYVCKVENCITVALRKTILDRALKTSISADERASVEVWLRSTLR